MCAALYVLSGISHFLNELGNFKSKAKDPNVGPARDTLGYQKKKILIYFDINGLLFNIYRPRNKILSSPAHG